MPFNGTGTFNRSYNWVNDKANGINITASRMDGDSDGFATGLSTCITKDGQQTTTARIPFAAGLSFTSGTAMSTSINLAGDITTGIYSSAAGAIDIASSGVRVGGFTAAGLDNTVIGAGTPLAASFTTLSASGNFAIATNKFTVAAASGNTVVAGTLNVTGAFTPASASITGNATVGGTLGVTGNFTVNTNKFIIAASSGDTTIAGTLFGQAAVLSGAITAQSTMGVAGNFAINTNKLTVDASNGNTVIAGTLGVTGGIGSTTATTQSAADNSTKVATTAYADRVFNGTPLAIGSIITAINNTTTIAAGATTAAANITPSMSLGSTGTWSSSGDTITGTWKAMQTVTNGSVVFWQRTA